jgi:hypothetical protein
METFNQYLGGCVSLGIEQLMGMTVAAEKTFQPKHIAVLGATKDDWSADPSLQDSDAAQDQSAHDTLAKFGFRNHQCAQPLRRDNECF